jgi:hypothetical protein
VLVKFYLHSDIRNFVPSSWNDQTYYWHQILTFRTAGFNGGYYLINERPPVITTFHFGAWGFLYPALLGFLARLTGWETYTGIFINMALIGGAIGSLSILLSLNRLQILFVGVSFLAVMPVLLFLPTISQESLHQTAAAILAVIFYRLINQTRIISRRFVLLSLLFIVVISIIRFSWLLMLPPFFLLVGRKLTVANSLKAFILTIGTSLAVILIFQTTSAPGYYSVFQRLGNLSPVALQSLLITANNNLQDSIAHVQLAALNSMNILALQFFMLLIASAVLLFMPGERRNRLLYLFLGYQLLSIFVMALFFYLPDGYFRLFGSHLLLGLLLLAATGRYRIVAICAVLSLIGINLFLADYRSLNSANFAFQHEKWEEDRAALAQHLVYQPDATSPWCNTVLISLDFLNYKTTLIPPGIGVSFLLEPYTNLQFPLMSAYLWLNPKEDDIVQGHQHVEPIFRDSKGVLYRNLDSPCSPSP